jgi:dihydroorotate dehydrogenase electron transfer subunit
MSICYVDKLANEMWLLVQVVGEGTKRMAEYQPGDYVNLLLPLGNGFSMPQLPVDSKILLIGGGVGTAPLLFLGDTLKSIGFRPEFLIGSRTKEYMMLLSAFEKIGQTYLTTEDGSLGEKGYVTCHSILSTQRFDQLYTCGPQQMMVAVAGYARAHGIPCEVSLENRMACGFGVCLCCVEKTVSGNRCVCTEGPVFNINQLTWQI